MFIHIGGEYTLSDKWIIGVFDLDQTTTYGMSTQTYLSRMEEQGRLDLVSPDIPRSFVVTLDRVYLSPISSETLIERWQNNKHMFFYESAPIDREDN